MSRDESLYLADVQESCEKVLRFTKGMTYKDFVNDDLHFDAVLRNLEIIGEAVKNISEATRQKYPDVKWRKIAGFRDIVAHEYFGINDETVWDIVENEVPALLAVMKIMLEEK
ncbi:MAG TPA: DUF86 domain-containing protein [Anaerolineales bacterium]|nr:DUF86 domain-containing protein [Anaerolineales bacterium]HMV95569.1 DUF86 domain-containing protein [Anaerolineales bacterium]HMX19911.1 DUF86 domain-containing protein [Anaerolineales bacterium]HMX76450.1 DUF86 domain-containing protein [Anaerolineales bacterium]HMZ43634.1 DUF86 domain-containing protein [Anaerolineales bacterium]